MNPARMTEHQHNEAQKAILIEGRIRLEEWLESTDERLQRLALELENILKEIKAFADSQSKHLDSALDLVEQRDQHSEGGNGNAERG